MTMCSGSSPVSWARSLSTSAASAAGFSPSTSMARRPSASAVSPIRKTCLSSVSAAPRGASAARALLVRSGTSSPSVKSTGAPIGCATSEEAAIAACQSDTSTSDTAAGPSRPPVEG